MNDQDQALLVRELAELGLLDKLPRSCAEPPKPLPKSLRTRPQHYYEKQRCENVLRLFYAVCKSLILVAVFRADGYSNRRSAKVRVWVGDILESMDYSVLAIGSKDSFQISGMELIDSKEVSILKHSPRPHGGRDLPTLCQRRRLGVANVPESWNLGIGGNVPKECL
jgi:hypothetical protein